MLLFDTMRCFSTVVSRTLFAVLVLQYLYVTLVHAFTAGNLLPSYICGPTDLTGAALDGFPKSLGGWLPFVQRLTNPINPATGLGQVADTRVDFATDAGTLQNTQLLITNWHNRDTIVPCQKTIFVTTALTNSPTVINQIVPGQNHTITLTINGQDGQPNCDFYTSQNMVTAADIAAIALDGAVVYAMDSKAARVGTFLTFGINEAGVTTMQPWAACGANNIGIVHNQLISETGQYTNIIWQAPATLVPGTTAKASSVTFLGAADTDVGFGKHVSAIPVISPATAAAAGATVNVATPVVTKVAEAGKNLAVFFNSQAKNAPAANALVIPNSFKVTASFAGGTQSVTVNKQASAALIPITAAMKGQSVTVTVTASNTQNAAPSTSAPVIFQLAAGKVQAAVSLEMVLSLCPADAQKERAMYLQDADPDYQCAYQTQALLENGTVAFIQETVVASGAAAQQSIVSALPVIVLFAVIVAALARKV